uniref:8 kDa glycoprotein n=1 Tax=Echinococcus granulosus TaxID=6210 RepID=B6E486_ECHGR|nr:8 kDa glycoprotein [Echinococcus granulosus]
MRVYIVLFALTVCEGAVSAWQNKTGNVGNSIKNGMGFAHLIKDWNETVSKGDIQASLIEYYRGPEEETT